MLEHRTIFDVSNKQDHIRTHFFLLFHLFLTFRAITYDQTFLFPFLTHSFTTLHSSCCGSNIILVRVVRCATGNPGQPPTGRIIIKGWSTRFFAITSNIYVRNFINFFLCNKFRIVKDSHILIFVKIKFEKN